VDVEHQRLKGGTTMRLFLSLLGTVVVMVLLLFAVGLLGGIGTVELTLWAVLLLAVVAVVTARSRRGASSQ
jgi:hypothetical protein